MPAESKLVSAAPRQLERVPLLSVCTSLAHRNLVTKKYSSMNDIESTKGEIVMYQPDETIRLEVRMGEETVWLTQQQMAELFQRDQSVIARHIRNIYKEEELSKEGTYAKFAYMGHDGLQKYEVIHYNLDVIISVGYRVKSKRGTQFRQWLCRADDYVKLKGCSNFFCNPFLLFHFT